MRLAAEASGWIQLLMFRSSEKESINGSAMVSNFPQNIFSLFVHIFFFLKKAVESLNFHSKEMKWLAVEWRGHEGGPSNGLWKLWWICSAGVTVATRSAFRDENRSWSLNEPRIPDGVDGLCNGKFPLLHKLFTQMKSFCFHDRMSCSGQCQQSRGGGWLLSVANCW